LILAVTGCSKQQQSAQSPATPQESAVAPEVKLASSQPPANSNSVREDRDAVASNVKELMETWGIEPVRIALSANGYMLDFRYRILDADKALPLMAEDIHPLLIDLVTGAKMCVPAPPKLGPLRQRSAIPYVGRVYFVMFANPGRYIKRGNAVTVVIGDCTIEDLTVQ